MANTITMERVRLLYDNTLDSFKMDHLNEKIANLDGNSVMAIIHISFITKKFANLSAKIQALETL